MSGKTAAQVQAEGAHVPQQLTTHESMSGGVQLNACEKGFARPTVNRKKKKKWLVNNWQAYAGRPCKRSLRRCLQLEPANDDALSYDLRVPI